jgi:hypothetical protein
LGATLLSTSRGIKVCSGRWLALPLWLHHFQHILVLLFLGVLIHTVGHSQFLLATFVASRQPEQKKTLSEKVGALKRSAMILKMTYNT